MKSDTTKNRNSNKCPVCGNYSLIVGHVFPFGYIKASCNNCKYNEWFVFLTFLIGFGTAFLLFFSLLFIFIFIVEQEFFYKYFEIIIFSTIIITMIIGYLAVKLFIFTNFCTNYIKKWIGYKYTKKN